MADFIKNNGDLLKSTIGLILALIPPVIAIVTYLRNRIESTKEPVDNLELKAIKILRHPIDKEPWESMHIKAVYTSCSSLVLAGLLYLILSIFLLINASTFLTSPSTNFFYKILVALYPFVYGSIVLGLIFFVSSKSYKYAFDDAKQASYYIFKDVDIVIKANYHYLFSKCLNVLKSMKYQIVAVDEEEEVMQAAQLAFRGAVRVKLQIKKVEGSEEMYKIELEFLSEIDDFKKSKICNFFIDRLISKPKGVDDKAKNNKTLPSEEKS